MTSQRVERTWIRTGSYGRFRGEWVKIVKKITLKCKNIEVINNNNNNNNNNIISIITLIIL